MARVTIEGCLRRIENRYMLVHVAVKRVRQMREGAQYLVQSPKNEDIVIALREIAAGKISINGKESEDREEKRRARMSKSQKGKVTTTEAKPAVKETTVKKSGRKTTTKKPAPKKAADVRVGIKKEYPKSTNVCEVTFTLPKIAAPDAKSVCIVGDFNDWNIHANRMKKQKNGGYTLKLKLQPGKEYQFRYLIDGSRWENDWNADRYVRSPYGGSDNSVIVL